MQHTPRLVWPVVLALALTGCTSAGGATPTSAATQSAKQSEQFTPTLTFALPSEWAVFEDLPSNFAAAPASASVAELEGETADAIFVNNDVYASNRDCSSEAEAMSPQPGVGTTPQDMVEEFIARGSVTVSEPQDVALGGLNGLMIDLTRNPAWPGDNCQIGLQDDPSQPIVLLYAGVGGLLHGFAPGVDTPKRYYLLADPDGDGTIIVELQDADTNGFDEMESIVQTFSFATH
ncbi:hypothetical protein ACH3VR_19775 [Microbacterium sp. B2969]|uniref:Lipoprotein n=1 Tax=Microbacterium alkaliflavum TaxID=3248839 RepID=A0ABW7QD86_9MICO